MSPLAPIGPWSPLSPLAPGSPLAPASGTAGPDVGVFAVVVLVYFGQQNQLLNYHCPVFPDLHLSLNIHPF